MGLKNITVFATQQTVKSRAYAQRARILDAEISVQEIALSGDLVRDIESLLPVHYCRSEEDFSELMKLYDSDGWNCDSGAWRHLVEQYFSDMPTLVDSYIQGIILGCTHYSYLRKPLQRLFPQMTLIDPSEEAAEKMGDYVQRKSIEVVSEGLLRFL